MPASANATSIGSDAALVRIRIAMSRWADPLATRSATRAATVAASSASSAHATISGATPEGRWERSQTAVASPATPPDPAPAGPAADPDPAPASPSSRTDPTPVPVQPARPVDPARRTAAPPITALATATISGVQR